MRKEIILLGVIGLLLIIVGFNLGVAYEIFGNSTKTNIEVDDYMQCGNLGLEETANCLVGYVSNFYEYKVREDKDRTIGDIRENGGDCYDYNKLYENMGRALGFYAYSFRIESESTAHRIAVIMDDSGYCEMDMLSKPNCLRFGSIE